MTGTAQPWERQDVVGRANGLIPVLMAGRVLADLVAEEGDAPRLVVGHPVFHPVAQVLRHHICIFDKRFGGGSTGPAARILQNLGQIPVVEGGEGGDTRLQQPVHQATVEVETGLVDFAPSVGQNARPSDGEAIGLQPQFLHHPNVVGPAVVVIAGHIARVAVVHFARRAAEAIPDGFALAVFVPRAFDLKSSRCAAPLEARPEGQ